MSQRLADLQEAPQPLVTYEAVEVEILKNRIESLGYRLWKLESGRECWEAVR